MNDTIKVWVNWPSPKQGGLVCSTDSELVARHWHRENENLINKATIAEYILERPEEKP